MSATNYLPQTIEIITVLDCIVTVLDCIEYLQICQVGLWVLLYWVHFFSQLIDARTSTFKSALQLSTILDYCFSEVKFPSYKKHNCFWHFNNSKIFQIADDETDDEEAATPIIYQDKDTDDEESDVDAMETDEESGELCDITDAFEHSDGSEIMSDWLAHAHSSRAELSIMNHPYKILLESQPR